MTFEIAFVFILVLSTVLLFVTERFPVDLVALMVMATLLVSRVISLEEGISGFSNTATVTVAAMFVVSAGLFKTGALKVVSSTLERIGRHSFWVALIAMMLVVGLLSAFVNNTATVAIFMPIVLGIAREAKVSPSKLMMPLSFASIFGGACTLIGTSTNILVSSISEREGLGSFGMFEFLPIGLMIFFVGIVYMIFIGVPMIPKKGMAEDLTDKFGMGDYLTEIILLQKAKSVGKTLKNSPLVKDLDIDILEVFRGGRRLSMPSQEIILQEYDVLRVRANVNKIREIQEREGIVIKSGLKWRDKDLESEHAILVEAVIAPHSMLDGKSLEAIGFRDRFGASPLAIRHSGAVQHEKLETAILRGGDALLIEVKRDHLVQLKKHPAFVFISEVEQPTFRKQKVVPALAVVFGVVIISALGILPIVVSAIVGAIILILSGCLTLEEAYEAIDWKVIFFITNLLTEAMSNNASAALLAPIAIVAAESQGWDARPFLMAVMFGASLSFMTPVGYQTNTLIYGPGQYRFSDFLRVGTPLNIMFWLLCTWFIPKLWPF